jgi:hypothetical protein
VNASVTYAASESHFHAFLCHDLRLHESHVCGSRANAIESERCLSKKADVHVVIERYECSFYFHFWLVYLVFFSCHTIRIGL